jgi:hypothetical protein
MLGIFYLFFKKTGYSTRSCITQIDIQNIWSSGPSCICMPCPCSTPAWCAHTCLQGLPTVPVLPLCRDASDMSVRLRAQYNGIFLCSIPTFSAYDNSMGAKTAARMLSSYCEPSRFFPQRSGCSSRSLELTCSARELKNGSPWGPTNITLKNIRLKGQVRGALVP